MTDLLLTEHEMLCSRGTAVIIRHSKDTPEAEVQTIVGSSISNEKENVRSRTWQIGDRRRPQD